MKEAYLVVDVGTGNVRVALIAPDGEVLDVQTQDMRYHKDTLYPDALYFEPDFLWRQISEMINAVLKGKACKIIAVTASSQREGMVLVDKNGAALIGLPNIDHRGREWEAIMEDKSKIYQLSGRFPTSLFSALKLIGLQKRRPEMAKEVTLALSISDWVEFMFSGVPHFEHSHASETLWYDIQNQNWSPYLLAVFNLDETLLPPLVASGEILGKIKPSIAHEFGINAEAVVIVGGADTQLAAKSTQPLANDVIIVSGTTTPIIKIDEHYQTDEKQRTWTGRHVEPGLYMVETNAGVTGLNYQRLKEVFYPNESYEVMEKELEEIAAEQCVAALGSLVASEKDAPTKGGFVFDVPVSHLLKRADFVYATLWDIACSIKENYDCLSEVAQHNKDYVLACGGGFQSKKLRQFLANLLGKKIIICNTFRQSSAIGGALICNQALGKPHLKREILDETPPLRNNLDEENYQRWKTTRQSFTK